jgi:NTP pyrophosphatase (non-canonical NTP hydrolase)
MYYIYYIQNEKVGCTNNLKRRVEQEQGENNYIVLGKTNNINIASQLEIHWQNVFGYKQDKISYKETLNLKTEKMNNSKNYYVTQKSITLKGTDNKNLTGYIFPNEFELLDGSVIQLNNKIIDFIKKNNYKSQNNKERYIYTKKFILEANNLKEDYKNIFDNIRQWAADRNIYNKGNSKTQYIKLQEEAGELAKAILKNDKVEIIDAIGDMVVVLTNLAKLENLKIEDCIQSAYNIISKRTGKMINGTFVKNK